ncbi:MAG: PcfB family protein [Faecousia sp.]
MQEEVEHRVVTLVINCTKLTEQELRKALGKFLAQIKTKRQNKQPHGKMTVKQLAAQNRGLQSVEVTDQNVGSFKRIARKYGIDFAPYKAKGQDRYLIFFKSQDADAMTAAFKEYTEQIVNKKSRPSVLAKLQQFKALIQSAVVDRTKKKELER